MGGVTQVRRTNGGNGKTETQRLAEAEAIINAHVERVPISVTMERLGISQATYYRRLNDAFDRRIDPAVDRLRKEGNAEYDRITAHWVAQLEGAEAMLRLADEKGDTKLMLDGMSQRATALTGWLRVSERRARLNGTDAPVKVDATVRDVTPTIDSAVLALAEEIKTRSLT